MTVTVCFLFLTMSSLQGWLLTFQYYLNTLSSLFGVSWIAYSCVNVNHNSKQSIQLLFLLSFHCHYLVLLFHLLISFYHIGEYQLFSISNPHMVTERHLTNGDSTACYFRVVMLRNVVFSPSLQCRHSVSYAPLSLHFVLMMAITLSYGGVVSYVYCLSSKSHL